MENQEHAHNCHGLKTPPGFENPVASSSTSLDLGELYSANVSAKIWGVAQRAFSMASPMYPLWVVVH